MSSNPALSRSAEVVVPVPSAREFSAWAWWALGEIAAHARPADSVGAREAYGRSLILAEELGMAPLAAHVSRAIDALGGR